MNGDWTLRYAPHLGYLPGGEPLFRESVGGIDPRAHVAFAAHHGFAGMLYPWAVARPDEEVARFRAALEEFGLASGCIVFGPIDAVLTPLWTRADGAQAIDGHLDSSIPLARDLGASLIAVLLKADETADRAMQEKAAVAHLRRAGDRAAEAGVMLGVEPMIELPGMLLETTSQALDLLDRVNHPAVRLIFDTGHVAMMDGDVLAAYRSARNQIGLLQLADMPGRVQPGAGAIDFATLLAEARADGNADGLIELEHGWSEGSAATEQEGIDALRRIDANLGETRGQMR